MSASDDCRRPNASNHTTTLTDPFDPEAFRQPPNDYRPLQIVHGLDRLVGQVDALTGLEGIDARLSRLRSLGIGGIVANVGFSDYLVDSKQWEILRYGLRKADELGMVVWLYDEQAYPSGAAGGYVTRAHPEYVARGLAAYALNAAEDSETCFHMPESCGAPYAAFAVSSLDDASSDSIQDISACVDAAGTLRWQAPEDGWTVVYVAERVMYEGTHAAANFGFLRHYPNLLEPGAGEAFIRLTHERYAREIPKEQWRNVRAIFTDEPSLMTTYAPDLPDHIIREVPVVDGLLFRDRPPAVPWAGHMAAEFQRLKGYDLRPFVYALFFSDSEEACAVRQDYYDVVTRLYADAFYGQILDWCTKHGICSSGHVLAEEDIIDHVPYHGSLFAVIRKMNLPGIDELNSDAGSVLEGQSFMTAKQVSSAAHLSGAKQVHSESSDLIQRLVGRERRPASLGHRRGQGNLLHVLGINTITAYWLWGDAQEEIGRNYSDVQHAFGLTMPGDIGDDGYRAYNEYMGRLALLLRGGVHVCDVAVLYPIRAAWARYRPTSPLEDYRLEERTPHETLGELSHAYAGVVRTLLRNQVDLDIIDEEALLTGDLRDAALCAADEAFRVILLPPMDTLSLEVAQRLSAFVAAGGSVVFTGDLPHRADSLENTSALQAELQALEQEPNRVKRADIASAPAVVRSLVAPDLRLKSDNPDILYTHRRNEGRDLYFIINNSERPVTIEPVLRLSGPCDIYRPLTGAVETRDTPSPLDLAGHDGVFIVPLGGQGDD